MCLVNFDRVEVLQIAQVLAKSDYCDSDYCLSLAPGMLSAEKKVFGTRYG